MGAWAPSARGSWLHDVTPWLPGSWAGETGGGVVYEPGVLLLSACSFLLSFSLGLI